jgi:hypothetical protein
MLHVRLHSAFYSEAARIVSCIQLCREVCAFRIVSTHHRTIVHHSSKMKNDGVMVPKEDQACVCWDRLSVVRTVDWSSPIRSSTAPDFDHSQVHFGCLHRM